MAPHPELRRACLKADINQKARQKAQGPRGLLLHTFSTCPCCMCPSSRGLTGAVATPFANRCCLELLHGHSPAPRDAGPPPAALAQAPVHTVPCVKPALTLSLIHI